MRVLHSFFAACGLALLVVGLSTAAQARLNLAPEIDPGSIGSALALFTGSVMYLTSRRRVE